MILGIAYHSPLDITALMPLNINITLNPLEISDVLITDKIIKKYNSRIQLVFASNRTLYKSNIPIIDQGAWGTIVHLNSKELEKILGRYNNDSQSKAISSNESGSSECRSNPHKARIPRWVRF